MASQVSNDAFGIIFPRYKELLAEQSAPTNQSIETFLRDQLPRKVEMVRNMESCFNAFLAHFTNIILKRPQHAHLIHSLILKANDKIENFFQSLNMTAHKIDSSQLRDRLPSVDPQVMRKEFRAKLDGIGSLLKQKYFVGGVLNRQCQEEVAMRLYVLFQMYYFLKGDPVSMAGKFKIAEQDVLWSVSHNDGPPEIENIISLDVNFIQNVEDVVMKRCRPFVNRRQLLESKVRQALREGESRVGPNLNLFIETLISKQRTRVLRELSTSLTRQFRTLQQGEGQAEVKEMINEVQSLKREFHQIKNTIYFLDIMRGNFSEKYKMEINKLQNIFYLTNLQKYLQDVSTFLQKVLSLQQRIIANRKQYMRDFGSRVDIKIADLVSFYESKPPSTQLSQLIQQQFELLQSALYGIVHKKQSTSPNVDNYRREDREQRAAERRRKMEEKAEEDRIRREEEKARMEEKRQKQEQRIRMARIERQEKDKQRRQEQNRQQQIRRAELQRRREEKSKKDEELRRNRQEQVRRREEQRKIKQAEDKAKRDELTRKKAQEQEQKRRQRQQDNKRRQEQRKKILEKQQQQKKIKEAELKQRKQKEQQDRLRRENQRKAEEQKIKRQKEQRQQQFRRKQQERIQKEKEKREKDQRQAEERRKQEERKRLEKQQKEKQQRLLDEKRREEEKKEKERKQKQERDRKERQRKEKQAEALRKQQQRKQQQQRKKKQKQQKDRQIRQQKQRQRKAEEDRIAKQKEEKRKRDEAQKARIQKERKQKEEKQRLEKEKAERQRQERERLQRQRKQKQRLQKEKQQKQRLQREKQQKERQQRQRKQKQQEQKRIKAEKERKEKQQKAAEEKARVQRERIQKQKRDKEEKERQAQIQRKKKQAEAKAQPKPKGKNEPKKSSGIDYGDFDDILDDDLEEMQRAGKMSPSGIASKSKIQDDYGDDFQSPQKEEESVSTKELISHADIKCLNDYMKGTSYSRKNKVNAQSCNKQDKYLQVFEQFVQNRKMFIFSSAISKAVMQLGGQLANPDTPQEDLHMSIDTIKQEMLRSYDDVLPGEQLFPVTRYIYPFSFKNQFNVRIIQMIPAHTYFRVIFDKPLPEDESINQKFQCLIQGLLHVFDLQSQPQMQQSIISQQSKMVLDTFQRELPCLLVLFAYHYQLANPKNIVINQYTIQRFFYTSNIIVPFYDAIKEGEQLDQFYGNLFQKYSTHDKIKIHNVAVTSSDPQYSQQLTQSSLAIKDQFKKGKHLSVLTSFAIEMEEEGQIADKVVVYMSIDRASPKPVVNYFLINKDREEEENASVVYELIGQGDQGFDVNVYTEFTRHNCLSTYSDWALPLWGHVMSKRKLSSLQAIRAITFAMTPFYLAFKEVD